MAGAMTSGPFDLDCPVVAVLCPTRALGPGVGSLPSLLAAWSDRNGISVQVCLEYAVKRVANRSGSLAQRNIAAWRLTCQTSLQNFKKSALIVLRACCRPGMSTGLLRAKLRFVQRFLAGSIKSQHEFRNPRARPTDCRTSSPP